MREFIKRALQKTSRMNGEQVQGLLSLVTEEYELLDAVLDSLGTGVIVCDSFHLVVQNNKAAARILPLEFHDIQDKPVWACIRNPDLAAFVRETIETEETVQSQEFFLDEASSTRFSQHQHTAARAEQERPRHDHNDRRHYRTQG